MAADGNEIAELPQSDETVLDPGPDIPGEKEEKLQFVGNAAFLGDKDHQTQEIKGQA